ncbi:murein L,D-transpeptidase catalytic domain family protein [Chryseobacterium chendengshani]|uniref:murein L,D-transpeptidase catalytic domain family protein n=1 Tax=Chryseobacterium sp. LJ668 TaxID=2864040 RepID=UPI001C693F40|nr:murein L,D-transpeptidase catalytic domain family protein [Chryseobacterium sp. LJ668]MBW8521922.1 murein L,D-transpeptidase catalytic domain family protein [Chryseobacterium sp. LJ668]QYK17578.1 murein L,D-transpeptidase catalytic domain family protein [Chryseobacterium sp. LJ668]
MKGFYSLLGIVYLISTSFYLSPKKADNNRNFKSTNKIETIVETKSVKNTSGVSSSEELYNSILFENDHKIQFDVFAKALLGFENLKKAGKIDQNAHLLTICDFSMSSNTKRLWVIDTDEKKVLFNSLVAHGKNTGEEFATNFSNTESSLQSSMGFYITESTYNGDNGYSLKLLGMDKGFNDAAYKRAVVMHGADYVSEEFAAMHKRIGRSWGCPAIPRSLAEPIINTIKGKNCLFIYYPDENYLSSSEWLKA